MPHNTIMSKQCSICREEKPISEFYKEKRASDGLASRCKACHKEAMRPVRQRDKEERRKKRKDKQKKSLHSRFWAKVDVRETDECWEWQGTTTPNGYGQIWVKDKMVGAHVASYELNVGPIPDGMTVLHTCDRRSCVNPRHLWAGTHNDNMADMVSKDRQYKERDSLRKLTENDVRDIRERCSAGEFQHDLAEEYGVHTSTVHRLIHRHSWRHTE